MALGERWIAFPGNQKLAEPVVQSPSEKMVEVAKDVAKDLASRLGSYWYYNNYNGEQAPPRPSLEHKEIESELAKDVKDLAGIVVIVDIPSQSVITMFRAHFKPLEIMGFDPTGTLLVTASTEGHNLHVYQICPTPNAAKNKPVFEAIPLYHLNRGLTDATIRNISFSEDTKWLAATTSRGTTHLFPLSSEGGKITPYTHTSEPLPKFIFQPSEKVTQKEFLTAYGRIWQQAQDEHSNALHLDIPTPGGVRTLFLDHKTKQLWRYGLFLFNPATGFLTLHDLTPRRPADFGNVDPNAIELQ